MGRAGVAALEQPAVVEEDVHELPEHVVERLHELLADRGIANRRLELPLRAGGRERERQAAALPRESEGRGGLAAVVARAEADRDVVRLGHQRQLVHQRAALARQSDRGQRALADDHRVHELDGHVPGVGAGRGRAAEGDQPAAAREALGHPVTEAREPLRLGLEELRVCLSALGQRRLEPGGEDIAAEDVGQAGASTGAPTRASQSRHSSIPSPVFALTMMRSTPGWTASRL